MPSADNRNLYPQINTLNQVNSHMTSNTNKNSELNSCLLLTPTVSTQHALFTETQIKYWNFLILPLVNETFRCLKKQLPVSRNLQKVSYFDNSSFRSVEIDRVTDLLWFCPFGGNAFWKSIRQKFILLCDKELPFRSLFRSCSSRCFLRY